MPKFWFCLKYRERARHATINHRGEETPHSTLILSSISQRSYAQCSSKTTRQNLLVHAEEIDLRGERAKEDEAFVDNSTIFLEDEAFVDDAAAFNDAFVEDVTTLTCVKDKAFVDEVATLAFAEQVPKTLGIWTASTLVSPGEHQRLTGSYNTRHGPSLIHTLDNQHLWAQV